jgi:hypothetical protein
MSAFLSVQGSWLGQIIGGGSRHHRLDDAIDLSAVIRVAVP